MERPESLEILRIDHDNWELDDLGARLNLLVFDTSGLKVKDKQVVEFHILKVGSSFFRNVLLDLLFFVFLRSLLPFALLKIVLDMVNLFLGEVSSVIFDEFDANCADVEHIVNAAVVFPFVLES